jgi:hypothetical protein
VEIKKLNTHNLISTFWLYIFPLVSFRFYGYVGFNANILKAILFAIIPLAFLFVLKDLLLKSKQTKYYNVVRALLLLFLFSILMAYVFWGQSIQLTYRAMAPQCLTIIYFFILYKIKPSKIEIERLIWFFCIIHILCWIYGIIKAPELVFGSEGEDGLSDDRGMYRLSIAGSGFLYLGFFVAVSKFVETKRKKWIFLFCGLFIIIVLNVLRQVIFFSFLVAAGYLLWKNKRLLIIIGIIGIGLFVGGNAINFSNDSVIGQLINLSERQAEEQRYGEENIRITAYKYLFTKYSANIITDIFGNGFPHEHNEFGQREVNMNKNLAIYASDVGYAAIFVRVGWLGLLCYLLLFYRAARQKVPPAFMYAKLFIIYVIFANIASYPVRTDIIVICICLFILEQCNLNENYGKNKILNRDTGI